MFSLTQVQLPLAEVETDTGGYDEESHEVGGIGAAAGKVQVGGCLVLTIELFR